MKSRKDSVELFSTFLQIDDQYDRIGPGWQKSPRLAKSMTQKVEKEPGMHQEYWAQYWLRASMVESPVNQLAREHLAAYLEEPCYWSALKIYQQLSERRVDVFQMARMVVLNPVKLFKNYDYTSSSVKTYAQMPLRSAVLDQLRKDKGMELDKYSWPALLRNITKKRLKNALSKANVKEPTFSRCLQAWQCFQEKYVPRRADASKQLQPPDRQELEVIASYYRQRYPSEDFKPDGAMIQTLLDLAVQVIRESVNTKTVALDDSPYEPVSVSEPSLEEIEETEEETERFRQIGAVLSQTLEGFAQADRLLLQFWYGLGMTQSALALIFGFEKQYQVSRKKDKLKKVLLKALAQWSQETLAITLTSNQLSEMSKLLDIWLEKISFAHFCHPLKQSLIDRRQSDELKILKLSFGRGLKLEEVVQEMGRGQGEIEEAIAQVKSRLEQELYHRIETEFQLSLPGNKAVQKAIADFVELYLYKLPYGSIGK
jgi:RNA polymerase sigma factor (sigma-70 family)